MWLRCGVDHDGPTQDVYRTYSSWQEVQAAPISGKITYTKVFVRLFVESLCKCVFVCVFV